MQTDLGQWGCTPHRAGNPAPTDGRIRSQRTCTAHASFHWAKAAPMAGIANRAETTRQVHPDTERMSESLRNIACQWAGMPIPATASDSDESAASSPRLRLSRPFLHADPIPAEPA